MVRLSAIPLALALLLGLSSPTLPGQETESIPKPQEEPRPPAPEGEGETTPEPDPVPVEIDEVDALDVEGLGGELDRIVELADEITENMRKIEELLDQRDTGNSTQGAQGRTVEQIDELIELVEKACSTSSGGGGGGSSQARRQSSQENRDQQIGDQQRQLTPEELQEQRRREQSEQAGDPRDGSEKVPNDRTSEGPMPPSRVGDLNDPQGSGRWGRLPRTVIEKMYDNGRRKLPEKYRILLEDYFRRLPDSVGQ